jgi:hypothetical protein
MFMPHGLLPGLLLTRLPCREFDSASPVGANDNHPLGLITGVST